MRRNDYLRDMLKSEEHAQDILVSRLDAEKRARRVAEKKAHDAELRVSALLDKVQDLQSKLDEQLCKVTELVSQTAALFMGNGAVILSDSLKESLVGAVRNEFESQKRELVASFNRERQEMLDSFALKLAAKDNEIAMLRGERNGGNHQSPTTSSPEGSSVSQNTGKASRIKQLEQQNANLATAAHGQHTESGKFNHGDRRNEDADTLDLNGENVPDEKIVKLAARIMGNRSCKGRKKPHREQPLFSALDGVDLEQEAMKPEDRRSVVVLRPEGLPSDAYEIGEDVTERLIYVKGYVRPLRIVRKKYRDPRGARYYIRLPEKYKDCMGRTKATDSLVSEVLTRHFEDGMTIGDIELWLKDMGVNFSHATIVGWFELAAGILEPLDKPLQGEIITDEHMHSDESTLKTCDARLPGKGEREEDVEPEEHYFKRWIFCHYSPKRNLTQYIFHDRGRRTREAEQKYLEEVTHKIYLHTDGAMIYKCYDVCELIVRVACLVHMRRPLYKLRHVSEDAKSLVDIIDSIFHSDKEIKKRYRDPDDIKRERNLQLAPLLNDLKQALDRLYNLLDPEKDPELLKAVKYVLVEYPCVLHCLEDGLVDLSNNCCERQIRRIAKYRNNSFFVGSPEAGVRFARLQSVFANIRNHKLNAVQYLCDVFRRIKKTAKEELVNLLPHKWQPLTL
ncbi:IS66 family transposase [Parabacteroides sp. ZJ-118]|uniref:IS66 family transposase n=1 Tax=Parabacteroides sp. ZJ-118 TaxID=2709398 RepID=UPI0013EBAB71|nr:IS66 family transposase [Parabacteroides sp. ZJ-118]